MKKWAPTRDPKAPVDLQRLRDVCGDAPGTMRKIADLYLEQGAELLPAMEMAIRNNDAKHLRSIAHRFRGASLSCGSNSIVPFLNELEQMGNSGNLEAASAIYEKASSEFAASVHFSKATFKIVNARSKRKKCSPGPATVGPLGRATQRSACAKSS